MRPVMACWPTSGGHPSGTSFIPCRSITPFRRLPPRKRNTGTLSSLCATSYPVGNAAKTLSTTSKPSLWRWPRCGAALPFLNISMTSTKPSTKCWGKRLISRMNKSGTDTNTFVHAVLRKWKRVKRGVRKHIVGLRKQNAYYISFLWRTADHRWPWTKTVFKEDAAKPFRKDLTGNVLGGGAKTGILCGLICGLIYDFMRAIFYAGQSMILWTILSIKSCFAFS